MIGYLEGTLIENPHQWVIINVNGVGYEVHVPLTILLSLGKKGSN